MIDIAKTQQFRRQMHGAATWAEFNDRATLFHRSLEGTWLHPFALRELATLRDQWRAHRYGLEA